MFKQWKIEHFRTHQRVDEKEIQANVNMFVGPPITSPPNTMTCKDVCTWKNWWISSSAILGADINWPQQKLKDCWCSITVTFECGIIFINDIQPEKCESKSSILFHLNQSISVSTVTGLSPLLSVFYPGRWSKNLPGLLILLIGHDVEAARILRSNKTGWNIHNVSCTVPISFAFLEIKKKTCNTFEHLQTTHIDRWWNCKVLYRFPSDEHHQVCPSLSMTCMRFSAAWSHLTVSDCTRAKMWRKPSDVQTHKVNFGDAIGSHMTLQHLAFLYRFLIGFAYIWNVELDPWTDGRFVSSSTILRPISCDEDYAVIPTNFNFPNLWSSMLSIYLSAFISKDTLQH